MKFPSSKTPGRWIFAFCVIAMYIYGETLQSHKTPEEQTTDILKKYLVESGESDRMRFANCFRIEASNTDPPDVSFYVGCEVKKPLSADPIDLAVAFGIRGQVEFLDVSRGGK